MRAKTFAVKTRNALCVTPKIAGIESSANMTSVEPIARKTMNIGVQYFLPSSRVTRRLLPWYSSTTLIRLRRKRMRPFSRSEERRVGKEGGGENEQEWYNWSHAFVTLQDVECWSQYR